VSALVEWQSGLCGFQRMDIAPHDDRQEYNPPIVTAPAMSQDQFEYDNQRQIDDAVLLEPAMLAFVIQDLRTRVKELEERFSP
jgi:hypothetical protein